MMERDDRVTPMLMGFLAGFYFLIVMLIAQSAS